MDIYHDTSGYMYAGEAPPGPTLVTWKLQLHPSDSKLTPEPIEAHPIVWQVTLPEEVSASLVYWKTPANQFTNSDLELAGNVLHHACMA